MTKWEWTNDEAQSLTVLRIHHVHAAGTYYYSTAHSKYAAHLSRGASSATTRQWSKDSWQ